jgi:CBS domain-containing protein
MKPGAPTRLVEIRTVEIVTGRGRSITLSSVRCPLRGGAAEAVDGCGPCGCGEAVGEDELARGWVRCAGEADPGPGGPQVRDAMGRVAVALRPALARDVAADALRARGQASAPVVDGEGRPVGIVSEADLLRARPGARVADAMERSGLAVTDAAPLSRAAALIVARGAERIAVVGADGALVGVLSALDVVAWLAAGDGPLAGGGQLSAPSGRPGAVR